MTRDTFKEFLNEHTDFTSLLGEKITMDLGSVGDALDRLASHPAYKDARYAVSGSERTITLRQVAQDNKTITGSIDALLYADTPDARPIDTSKLLIALHEHALDACEVLEPIGQHNRDAVVQFGARDANSLVLGAQALLAMREAYDAGAQSVTITPPPRTPATVGSRRNRSRQR